MKRAICLVLFLISSISIVLANTRVGIPSANGEETADPALTQASKIATPSLPQGASKDWWSQVRHNLQAQEYHIRPLMKQNNVFQAPNRKHDFRTYFHPGHVEMTRRRADGWHWRLELEASGWKGATNPVQRAGRKIVGNRVEYLRGALTEWYLNNPDGLEQGFVINSAPNGQQKELVLQFSMGGDVTGEILNQGQRLNLKESNGNPVLELAKLNAWDARGTELATHFEWGETHKQLLLVVAAGKAEFPLIVDPLVSNPGVSSYDWIGSSYYSDANFGFSVASAGDFNNDGYDDVIIGSPHYDSNGKPDAGAVWLILGSMDGIASSSFPSEAAWGTLADENFGYSVAAAGDFNDDGYGDVIIGAPGTNNDAGAMYIYYGNKTALQYKPQDQVVHNNINDWFGKAVAGAGDVNGDGYADVMVGLPGHDVVNSNNVQLISAGAVYLYYGSGTGLDKNQPVIIKGKTQYEHFGNAVSGAGDVNADGFNDLIIGAPDPGSDPHGKAYVYHGSASPPSSPEPDWEHDIDILCWGSGDEFGSSVSGAGDVNGDGYADVLIGAPLCSSKTVSVGGAAFVYPGGANGLESQFIWSTRGESAVARLGTSVSGAGDVNGDGYADLIIGAPLYKVNNTQVGGALVYRGGANGPSTEPAWLLAGQEEDDYFGRTVAGAGDVNGDGLADIIVGASLARANDNGAAYVFHGAAENPPPSPYQPFESNNPGAFFGASVSGAGDINGDGFADFVVGAPDFDGGDFGGGAIFVYYGAAPGLPVQPAVFPWIADQKNSKFGYSVASAGDVNGDGYDDVIVGAHAYAVGEITPGSAFLYAGAAAGLSWPFPVWQAEGSVDKEMFGWSVAGVGDINGDGFADLAVGAPSDEKGSVSVFHGTPFGPVSHAATTIKGSGGHRQLGYSVAGAGDTNGDGFADVIVGDPTYSGTLVGEGAASLYPGSADGVSESSAWMSTGQVLNASFGVSVAGAGDVNGDSYADVIVGAQGYSNGQTKEGAAFVFHGSSTTDLSLTANWSVESNVENAAFGASVSGAGDVNTDGYADVLVGALTYTYDLSVQGAAFLYPGSTDGLSTTPYWAVKGGQSGAIFGSSVAGTGDANGDGFADILIGSRHYDHGEIDEGAAFLYLGNRGHSREVQLNQTNLGTDPVRIAPWGLSNGSDGYEVHMLGYSPMGRERIRLRVQSCPPYLAFPSIGGIGVGSCYDVGSSWVDPGTDGTAALKIALTGAVPGDLRRWRARLEYAPLYIQHFPDYPHHGPWRRLNSQLTEADIRVGEFCKGDILDLSYQDYPGGAKLECTGYISLTAGDGGVTIYPNADVTYTSPKIILGPGFSVKAGGLFKAGS